MKTKTYVIDCCPEAGVSLEPADRIRRKLARESPHLYRICQVPTDLVEQNKAAVAAMAAVRCRLFEIWEASDPSRHAAPERKEDR